MLCAQEERLRHDQGRLLTDTPLVLVHLLHPYQNRPCKIVEMSTSKTGKHGHAKVHLVALDIFTGVVKVQVESEETHCRQEAGGYLSLYPQHGGAEREAQGLPVDRDGG